MNLKTNHTNNTDFQKSLDRAKKIAQTKQVKSAIICYQEIFHNYPHFLDGYISQILHLGLSVRDDKNLFEQFLYLYPEIFEPLQSKIQQKSDVTNIYHCSVPKSASTWLKRIIVDSRVFCHSGLAPFTAEFLDHHFPIPENTIVTGTFAVHFEDFVRLPKPEKYKGFFVMRDPRDIIISAYFSNRYSHRLMDHIGETRKILNDLSVEDGILYTIDILSDVFSILHSWVEAPNQDSNILLFRYEDLTSECKLESFQRLFSHCDINFSEDVLAEILSDYSFENLSRGRHQGDENQNSHYRKGISGDWKNYFNEKIRQHFEAVAGDLITRLGYVWDGEGALGDSPNFTTNSSIEQSSPNVRNLVKEHKEVANLTLRESVEHHLQLGYQFYNQNKLEKAKLHYQNSAEVLQNYLAESYFYLGCIDFRNQKYEAAIDRFQKSLIVNPSLSDAHFYLGKIYQELNNLELSKHHYQQCLEFHPDLVDAHLILGNIYFKEQIFDRATVHYQKCLELNSQLAEPHFYLGNIQFHQSKLDRAMVHYQKCLELNPQLADAYFYLGEICIKRSQIENAIVYHKKYKALRGK